MNMTLTTAPATIGANWTDAVIDLSHWQAPVDFALAKAVGIAGVILKATQGSGWVDTTFVGRHGAAMAAGLLVGAYHFADATDPTAQAAHFLSMAADVPLLALDIEPNGMGDTVSIMQAAELAARIAMATGRAPLAYMPRYGPSGNGAGLPNSVLANCDLWLPEYGTNPITPPGWDAPMLWQYTQSGRVAGVGSACDRSRFAGTPDELVAWWTGATP
jgi:lysozyme